MVLLILSLQQSKDLKMDNPAYLQKVQNLLQNCFTKHQSGPTPWPILFFTILRIKTIFLQMCEKRSIEFNEEALHSGQYNYHSRTYLDRFKEQYLTPSKMVQEMVDKTREQFRSDADWNNSEAGSYKKSQVSHLFSDNDNTLIISALSIDNHFLLGVPKDTPWIDIRVSRGYYRGLLTNVFKHGTQRSDFLAKFKNVVMGQFDYLLPQYNSVYNDKERPSTGIECYHQPRLIAFNCLVPTSQFGVFMVKPRRVALVRKEAHKTHVCGFAYYQYLEFVDHANPSTISTRSNHKHQPNCRALSKYSWLVWAPTYKKLVYEFKAKNKDNPNSFLCFDPNLVFQSVPVQQRAEYAFSLAGIFKLKAGSGWMTTYLPTEFKDMIVPTELRDKYMRLLKLKELFYDKEFELVLESDKFKAADSSIIKSVSDEQGGFQLLKLIKSIPNLKFRLTPEQELMISSPNNLLCLGRSGTGKTTSSALRLFATEAYYKFHDLHRKFKQENPQAKNSDFKVPSDFLSQRSDVKLLFVSASPVLVNEIKRFFIEFKSHFTIQLEKTKNRKAGAQDSQPAQEEESKDQFQDYLQMEIKELEQEEQIEQQQSLVPSMDMLSSDDFPLFLTVKRLLYMIDASTDFPFFARDSKGDMIGMDTNVQWHNESGGVLMINQYYKSTNELDSQLKTLGTKFMDYSAELESGNADAKVSDSNAQQQEQKQKEQPQPEKSQTIGLGDLVDTSNYSFSRNYARTSQNLSFEVDFEVFKNKFWPKVAQSTKLTPLVVWTELFSEIKGRHDSWQFQFGGIPHEYYIRASRQKNTFLQVQERVQIYQIFLQYEKWKAQMQSYDINDLTNHILRQVKVNLMKESQTVHFLMVDEVQDLTQNAISLFMMLAEKNVFFSGDTAQTIAKGVGFRFFDLKQVFTRQNYDSQVSFQVPKVLQLVKNFRSHAKILDLANSVVSLLELLFPRTIDKLLKESSDNDGPKPILIDHTNDKNALRKLLEKYIVFGSKPAVKKSENNKDQQVQFGCTQVVIVRDQESKQKLPDFMRDILCLTVYEAKGLEFDDVILFNFFKDSKCDNQWNLINDVLVEQIRTKIKKNTEFLDFELLECKEEPSKDEINTQSIEGETEVTTVLKLKTHHDLVYRKFAQVCTELKLLYVAITRPKNFLLIYDDDTHSRKSIQDYWVQTKVVDHIDKKMMLDFDLIPEHIKSALRMLDTPDLDPSKNDKVTSEKVKQTWMLQGLKLFKVKYYRAAAQCFQNMGDQQLVSRCKAYEIADLAAIVKGDHDQKLAQVLDKKNHLNKSERSQLKNEAKELLKKFKEQMVTAGRIFCDIDMNQHAAQCFYSAGSIEDSAKMFIKQSKYGPAAECYFKLGQLRKAAELYSDAKLFNNAFECYERLEEWDSLLQCLHRHKDAFDKQERAALLEKYLPIALNSVYHMYAQMSQSEYEDKHMTEENKGKLQQMKLKLKFQRSVSIIKEENADEVQSEESGSESDPEPQPEVKPEVKPTVAEEPEESKVEMIDTKAHNQSDSYSLIQDDSQLDDQQIAEDEQDANVEVDAQDGNIVSKADMRTFELDLLSNIDPEDEFLQSQKSYSLIESVSNQSSFSLLQQSQSDYSIISGSEIHSAIKSMYSFKEAMQSNPSEKDSLESNLNIMAEASQGTLGSQLDLSRYSVINQANVETDTFAEDIVIQKIIYYISLFKAEVKACLKKAKEDDPLSQAVEEQASDDDFDFMMIELDELEPEAIRLVVDTLEQYEMYRLCIMMYSRFKLSEKIGKFVSAICDKYSNLNQFRLVCPEKFVTQAEVDAQRKYSLVAHEAVQNVLSMVGRSFDSTRNQYWMENNFEYFFVQGYWRKIVFMLHSDSSIQLTWVMSDYQSLKLQFLVQQAAISQPQELQDSMQNPEKIIKLLSANVCKSPVIAQLVRLAIDEESVQRDLTELQEMNLGYNNNQKATRICAKYVDFQTCNQQKQVVPWLGNFDKEGISFADYLIKTTKLDINRTAYFAIKALLSKQWIGGPESLFLDLSLHALTLFARAMRPNQTKLKRIVYKAFGVSMLDGLDNFRDFAGSYYIVEKESPLFADLMKFHDLELTFLKVKLILQTLQEHVHKDPGGVNFYSNFVNVMKPFVKDSFAQMTMKEQLQMEFAIVCDLQLGHWLVPKAWVEQLIVIKLLEKTSKKFPNLQNQTLVKKILVHIHAKTQRIAQKFLNPKLDQFVIRQKEVIAYAKQYQISSLSSYSQVCQLYAMCFGGSLDAKFAQTVLSSEEILKLNSRNHFQQMALQLNQQDINLALKPVASKSIAKVANLDYCLRQAIQDYIAIPFAKKSEMSNQTYRNFAQFKRLDSLIVFEELMRKKVAIAKYIKPVRYLLKAEQQARALNLTECGLETINFLNETYETLHFKIFHDLTLEAFAKIWFSFQVYNSPDGTITLPAAQADMVSINLRSEGLHPIQQIVDLRVSVGTTKAVRKALIWVECFLSNVAGYEGWADYISYFEVGPYIVHTVMLAEISFEQLCEFWPKMKSILQAAAKRATLLPEFENLMNCSYTPSPQFKKKMIEERDRIRSVKFTSLNYIQFTMKDRKAIMKRINQTNLDVSECFSSAQIILEDALVRRDVAARKICEIAQSLKRYKKPLREFKHDLTYLEVERRLRKSQDPQRIEKIAFAKQLQEYMKKVTLFTGCNIPHTSKDSIECFKVLRALSDHQSAFLKQICQAGHQDTSQLQTQTLVEFTKFNEWLEKQFFTKKECASEADVHVSAEVERKRFMKRERWDTVIQFHKKKRIMLKHFKSTLQAPKAKV